MEWIFSTLAIALTLMGLIGQGFEMRKIRASVTRDEDLASEKIFLNKRNFKWYVLIGAGLLIWFVTGGYTQ
ncbi:MAG: hypothetical protein ACE5JT_04360 [Nitrosopumilaceae archaeon]